MFDRNESSVYFLACSTEDVLGYHNDHILFAVNELNTQKKLDVLKRCIDEGKKVFLDSGIFNLAMEHARKHGVSHDVGLSMAPEEIEGFSKLWDSYGSIVTEYAEHIWGAVELDQGGVENKPRTRARIEKEFGITPIPVYHPLLDGWDYYDQLATSYDRICFGNIVKAAPGLRIKLAHTAYERSRNYPYLWTHLLGMTSNQNTLPIQMRGSMDSSAWLAPRRWPDSWRSPSMLNRIASMPPSMWQHRGTNEDYDLVKLKTMCSVQAAAMQETINSLGEDTHAMHYL